MGTGGKWPMAPSQLRQLLKMLSAQKLLEKIKMVDGPGSGLDADLLDGKQGNEFIQKTDILGGKEF